MSHNSGKQVFYGRVVHSKSLAELEILPKAALGITENGTIAFLDSSVASAKDACKKYHPDFDGATCTTLEPLQFLFPGLIDTHLHAPQWPNLALGMEGDLKEWLHNYTDPIEASYKNNEKAERVYSAMVRRELELGTTTCAYNSTIHYQATNILANICRKQGQRAIIGKLCILINSTHGNWEDSVERSLEDETKSVDYIRSIDPKGEMILPCIQPRGGAYCPPDLMAGLGKQAQNGGELIHVQAHMCETTTDIKEALKAHPKYSSYAEMYKAYGMLHEKSIMAHCIHLTETDMDLLKEQKAGVAHNPNSNTCLRDGECRVRELLDRGIKVGLGTDCSAGYSTFILDAMRQASNVSRHLVIHTGEERLKLSFEEIVYLGTMGGAQVVALDDKIGNFEVGKQFDALLVDVGIESMSTYVGEHKDDGSALVKKWVFLGDDRSIRKVYVSVNYLR
ncbi:hypothetical protein LTR50_002573 [Elasticomyces elasticus]|nr:hypothetical protein LTR50_002573 [Elasticomyces elasticus]